jgi:hypothetical protein
VKRNNTPLRDEFEQLDTTAALPLGSAAVPCGAQGSAEHWPGYLSVAPGLAGYRWNGPAHRQPPPKIFAKGGNGEVDVAVSCGLDETGRDESFQYFDTTLWLGLPYSVDVPGP